MAVAKAVDVEDVLESISGKAKKRELVTHGVDGIFGKVHPIGVVAVAFALLGIVFVPFDTDLLIGNLVWWHWLLVLATIAVSTQFALIDTIRAGIEKLSDFAISGIGVGVQLGFLLAVGSGIVAFIVMTTSYDMEAGVAGGFAIALLVGSVLMGPVWVLTWGVFVLALYSSLSRYIARFVERDLIISEVGSLAWQSFALIALLGVGYGVREGVNPRIDFWWADFSNRRKALLDFTLHVTLFIPFLIMALRILKPYAKTSLGFKRDFSGETDGQWPSGWRVWETWEQQGDAGQLPTGPIQAMIFVAFCLFLLQIIADTIKDGFVLINREDLGQISEQDVPLRVE